jgi:hypothetical protein
MITYRRRCNGLTEWTTVHEREPAAVRRATSSKPIDRMNNEELKAELKRRLPCCPPEKSPNAA